MSPRGGQLRHQHRSGQRCASFQGGRGAGQHVPGGVCAQTRQSASLVAGVAALVCAGRVCAPANMWFVFRVCVWWGFVNEVHSAMCVFVLARRGRWCCIPWPAACCLCNGACVEQGGDARSRVCRPLGVAKCSQPAVDPFSRQRYVWG